MENTNTAIAELIAGAALGVLNATTNTSGSVNMLSSIAGSLAVSATSVWPLKRQERFWSSQTAITGLNIVGASLLAHAITDALIHKHHEPKITFSPDCGCKQKSWAARVSENADTNRMLQV
jgi:hypothetical protein